MPARMISGGACSRAGTPGSIAIHKILLKLTAIPLGLMLLGISSFAHAQTIQQQSTNQNQLFQNSLDQNDENPDENADEQDDQRESDQRNGRNQASFLRPTIEEQLGRARRTNIRAQPVESNPPANVEEDPFAPLGIRIGTLRLNTSLEQNLGYTTNRQSVSDGDAGIVSNTIGEFALRSDWSRHSFQLLGRGTYETNFDSEIDPDPTIAVDGQLRLDLLDGVDVTLGAGYSFQTESATSININQFVIDEPGVHTYGAFGQIERNERKLGFTLRGGIERESYENAKLSGGGIQSQRDRNQTTYTIQSRLAYNNGLAISPFIQGDYSRTVFDLRVDRNGDERDSDTYELRGGIVLNLSEKLNGEISAGYINQEFVDPGLRALSGLTVDANLNWSPRRETLVSLDLASDLNSSTNAGDSGAITYQGTLSARHRARANLELNASLGLEYTNYEGLSREDTTFTAQAGFQYFLNRYLSITGQASYETLNSSEADTSFDETTVTLGIRLQR